MTESDLPKPNGKHPGSKGKKQTNAYSDAFLSALDDVEKMGPKDGKPKRKNDPKLKKK